MFVVDRDLIRELDVAAALEQELEYRPPYLPGLAATEALKAHREECAVYLKGFYRGGLAVAPAEILQVRKRRGGLRPVTVLPIDERVLYRALVAVVEPRLPALDRSFEAKERFEAAPLEDSGNRYVAVADVASFYPHVDHGLVEREIVAQTGESLLAEAISDFLGQLTGRQFGLPQVYHASDVLSELAIDIAERALIRAGVSIWRHNDDFRVASESWPGVNEGLAKLEAATREIGLTLNDDKTFLLGRRTYEESLGAPQERWSEIESEVEIDLRAVGPYGAEEPPTAEPDHEEAIERAAVGALDLVLRSPGRELDRLGEEVDRQLLAAAIGALDFIGSIAGVEYAREILTAEPQQTDRFARYMVSVIAQDEERIVNAVSEITRARSMYFSDWQALWLLEPLIAAERAPRRTLDWVKTLTAHTRPNLLRARAALTLAGYGEIGEEELGTLYAGVDRASAAEVVAAVSRIASPPSRLRRSIQRDSPINKWILENAHA